MAHALPRKIGCRRCGWKDMRRLTQYSTPGIFCYGRTLTGRPAGQRRLLLAWRSFPATIHSMHYLALDLQDFKVRPLEATDLPAVLEVYRQCEDFLALGPQPKASPEMVEADLQLSRDQGGAFCVIIHRNGVTAGVLDLIPCGFGGEPHTAFIELLMISVPFRRQGLGTRVVAAAESFVQRSAKATAVRAGVQVNNPAGIQFWLRMGYRIVSGAELMPDGTTAYQLLKNLEEGTDVQQ
jgi:ribosomal protein S18 acetylase RimI-like enzyme